MIELRHLSHKYYTLWLRIANLKNKTRILNLDFKKPWYDIILQQKTLIIISFALDMICNVFWTLIPLIIGKIIESHHAYLFPFIGAWLGFVALEYISMFLMTLIETQCIITAQYAAFQFFLTVDPIYHVIRSSGKLFAKIERGSRGYEDLFDILLFELSPVIIGMATVTVSFLLEDFRLGLLTFSVLLVITSINIGMSIFTGNAFETNIIDADDTVKTASVENLTQIQLIRSSFASNEIASTVKQKNKYLLSIEGTGWVASGTTILVTKILYILSILALGLYIFQLLDAHVITTTTAIALLITYLRGTSDVIKIGRKIRKLIKAVTRIKDLFFFVQHFGRQTFPVLSAPESIIPPISTDAVSLQISDLHFDYTDMNRIFQEHSLTLEVPRSQKNKLYGIIGPSGMGKSTLLAIIGGQLKPNKGTVLVNGISIYTVDDRTRRRLIALQNQVATNLSGTLKKNLLIGLHDDIYSDDELISILKQVGIWHIFNEKEGLNTYIGEGGLTLSGGQRQRLNFASLYIRAQYYRPPLILIDEPTSSLDEVSEKAITRMIGELAEHSLTMVIAHRLNTLESAIKILDISLLDQNKAIRFYEPQELKEHSSYYRNLLANHFVE